MTYLDEQLTPGEQVIFRTRLHPATFAGTAAFVAFVFAAAGLIVSRNDLPRETVAVLWLGAAVVALLGCVSPYLRWRTAEFAVTTRRVLVRAGRRVVHAFEIRRIERIEVRQAPWARLLGYGWVVVVGPDGAVDAFRGVARPHALREAVLRQPAAAPARR